jgi:hypothetical protein
MARVEYHPLIIENPSTELGSLQEQLGLLDADPDRESAAYFQEFPKRI